MQFVALFYVYTFRPCTFAFVLFTSVSISDFLSHAVRCTKSWIYKLVQIDLDGHLYGAVKLPWVVNFGVYIYTSAYFEYWHNQKLSLISTSLWHTWFFFFSAAQSFQNLRLAVRCVFEYFLWKLVNSLLISFFVNLKHFLIFSYKFPLHCL